MDHLTFATQIEEAMKSLRACSAFLSDFIQPSVGARRSQPNWMFLCGPARDLSAKVDELSEHGDTLMLYLRRRQRFLDQQVATEQRLIGLDDARLKVLAEALAGSRSLFQNIPELRDPSLLPALQSIALRIDEYDKEGEGLAVKFNTSLRGLRRQWIECGWASEGLRLIPDDVAFY